MSGLYRQRLSEPVVAADTGGRSWRGVLLEATRVDFRTEVYEPPFDSVLFGYRCAVPDCRQRGGEGSPWRERDDRLCSGHVAAWKAAGKPGPEWLAEARVRARLRPPSPCAVATCPRSASYGGKACQGHTKAWQRQPVKDDFDSWAATAPLTRSLGGACVVEDCRCACPEGKELCDHHLGHARSRGESVAEYLDHLGEVALSMRNYIDLRPLSGLLRMEVQYVLQIRHDEGQAAFSARLNPDLAWLGSLSAESLMDHDSEWWLARAGEATYATAARRRTFVAYAQRALHVLRDDAAGVQEWDRDVWRVERLGLDPNMVERSKVRSISFVNIDPAWLRDAYKRWSKWRLQLGRISPAALSSLVPSLKIFSDFLHEERIPLDRSEDLTREVLERFLAYVNGTAYSQNYKSTIISALRSFIDEAAQLDWIDVPRNARFFEREMPKQLHGAPRHIDESIMQRLETDEALARIDDLTTRTVVMLLMETGMRTKDARFLPFNPVREGDDGQPYLKFFNHKAKREAIIPISDRLHEQVKRQQRNVAERYPDGCRWLLPKLRHNPKGEQPFAYTAINKSLTRWLDGLQVTDHLGQPVRITAHQFRHTVGTRLINDDVPAYVVQRFLDHSSQQMTMVYARMHDATLRSHVQRYHQRVNRDGEVVDTQNGALADAAWMKERLARAKQALPNGYCGRPLVQQCPHPNACLTCDHFLTDGSFLDVHQEQLTQIDVMIAKAEENGWERMAENSQRDRISLINIIEGLTSLEDEQEAADAA